MTPSSPTDLLSQLGPMVLNPSNDSDDEYQHALWRCHRVDWSNPNSTDAAKSSYLCEKDRPNDDINVRTGLPTSHSTGEDALATLRTDKMGPSRVS